MFMQHLDKGMVKSLWDNKKINFKVHKKILLAANFSGAIACGLAVKSKAFSHLILASPIWDYQKHNERFDEQNLQQMTEFAKRAYKNVYRINFPNIINRLAKFKELKPEYYVPLLTLPVLVLHDPNDTMVAFRHTKEMIAKLQNVTYLEHYLGHGLSDSLINAFWKEIDKFIKINYI
jgi:pimeloyl-ACP methyl ester carboxylesterase